MKPVVVTPLHDPEGVIFPHLFAVEPQLKAVFGQVLVGITPSTYAAQPEAVERLTADPFYRMTFREPGMGVGATSLGVQVEPVGMPGMVTGEPGATETWPV